MTAPCLNRTLTRLGEELADWAAASERLEATIGGLLAPGMMAPGHIQTLQTLDGMSQHLRQLSILFVEAAAHAAPDGGDVSVRLHEAADRLNLDGLRARLTGAARGDAASEGVELW